jgi:regulator of protease activity HflC (stomatin/prohibitin superfamily)
MMDDFGIAESRMHGYWLPDAPVRTDNPRVLATAYLRPDESLIVLASWSNRDEIVRLTMDAAQMGRSSGGRVSAPAVEGLQPGAEQIDPGAVVVPANRGLFLRIARRR